MYRRVVNFFFTALDSKGRTFANNTAHAFEYLSYVYTQDIHATDH